MADGIRERPLLDGLLEEVEHGFEQCGPLGQARDSGQWGFEEFGFVYFLLFLDMSVFFLSLGGGRLAGVLVNLHGLKMRIVRK